MEVVVGDIEDCLFAWIAQEAEQTAVRLPTIATVKHLSKDDHSRAAYRLLNTRVRQDVRDARVVSQLRQGVHRGDTAESCRCTLRGDLAADLEQSVGG